MKEIFQKIVHFIMPKPIIEIDGIKFWSKKSYEQYLRDKPFFDAARSGSSIKKYYCPSDYTSDVQLAYSLFLNFVNVNQCPYRIIEFRISPCDSRLVIEYICDKIFNCSMLINC